MLTRASPARRTTPRSLRASSNAPPATPTDRVVSAAGAPRCAGSVSAVRTAHARAMSDADRTTTAPTGDEALPLPVAEIFEGLAFHPEAG